MKKNISLPQFYLNEIGFQVMELSAVRDQLQERNEFYPLSFEERFALSLREDVLINSIAHVRRMAESTIIHTPFTLFPIAKLIKDLKPLKMSDNTITKDYAAERRRLVSRKVELEDMIRLTTDDKSLGLLRSEYREVDTALEAFYDDEPNLQNNG